MVMCYDDALLIDLVIKLDLVCYRLLSQIYSAAVQSVLAGIKCFSINSSASKVILIVFSKPVTSINVRFTLKMEKVGEKINGIPNSIQYIICTWNCYLLDNNAHTVFFSRQRM